mgnify:CR=1 FL=1
MDEGVFSLNLRRVKLYGWQGYVGLDTLMKNINGILSRNPTKPVIVTPKRCDGNEENLIEYQIAVIYDKQRGAICGGHHRSFAHWLLSVDLHCRLPQGRDVLSIPMPRPQLYTPISELVVCKESELEENIRKRQEILTEKTI